MKCPNCGKEIANDSQFCEFCGAKVKSNKKTRLLWAICGAILAIILIIVFSVGGSKSESSVDVEEPAQYVETESSASMVTLEHVLEKEHVLIDGLYYNLYADNTAELVAEQQYDEKNYRNLKGTIFIPSSVRYNSTAYTVTSICEWAFNQCDGLTSVTIPNSVTSIGMAAFSACANLTSVNIPNSVTSIDDYTFDGCTNLTAIMIPNSVTSIGRSAFMDCSSLTSVYIPNSVKSIGMRAFIGCSALTSVKISEYTQVAHSAFSESMHPQINYY